MSFLRTKNKSQRKDQGNVAEIAVLQVLFFFFADGTHLFMEGDDNMFRKRTKEILELESRLQGAELSAKWWHEMSKACESDIKSVLEDNRRLRNELSELQSKLEKGEK